jgi:hypothetical protein
MLLRQKPEILRQKRWIPAGIYMLWRQKHWIRGQKHQIPREKPEVPSRNGEIRERIW